MGRIFQVIPQALMSLSLLRNTRSEDTKLEAVPALKRLMVSSSTCVPSHSLGFVNDYCVSGNCPPHCGKTAK